MCMLSIYQNVSHRLEQRIQNPIDRDIIKMKFRNNGCSFVFRIIHLEDDVDCTR